MLTWQLRVCSEISTFQSKAVECFATEKARASEERNCANHNLIGYTMHVTAGQGAKGPALEHRGSESNNH